MRRRGITLIEMLVVTFIIGVITTGLIGLLKRSWDNYDAIVVQNSVQKQARMALDLAADELRGLGPWNSSTISADENAFGSRIRSSALIPYVLGSFTLERNASNQLVRSDAVGTAYKSSTAVSNITMFRVQYVRRTATSNGSLAWETMPDTLTSPSVSPINNLTSLVAITPVVDARINDVALAYITVEASATARNGVTYSRRLQTAVRLRNNSYVAAPSAR